MDILLFLAWDIRGLPLSFLAKWDVYTEFLTVKRAYEVELHELEQQQVQAVLEHYRDDVPLEG